MSFLVDFVIVCLGFLVLKIRQGPKSVQKSKNGWILDSQWIRFLEKDAETELNGARYVFPINGRGGKSSKAMMQTQKSPSQANRALEQIWPAFGLKYHDFMLLTCSL